MRRVPVLVACVVLLCAGALGQPAQPSPAPSAEQVLKFMDLVKVRAQTELLLNGMKEQFKNQFAESFKKQMPDAPAGASADFLKIVDDIFAELPVDDLLKAMVPVYQKYLTAEEVDGLIRFYSSPLGQSVLNKMPAMMNEAIQVSAATTQARVANVDKIVQQRLEEMKKKYSTPGPGSAGAQPAGTPPKP